MVLQRERTVPAPKWLWLAVGEALLTGWVERTASKSRGFDRDKRVCVERVESRALGNTPEILQEGLDLTKYEGASSRVAACCSVTFRALVL